MLVCCGYSIVFVQSSSLCATLCALASLKRNFAGSGKSRLSSPSSAHGCYAGHGSTLQPKGRVNGRHDAEANTTTIESLDLLITGRYRKGFAKEPDPQKGHCDFFRPTYTPVVVDMGKSILEPSNARRQEAEKETDPLRLREPLNLTCRGPRPSLSEASLNKSHKWHTIEAQENAVTA